MNTVRVLILAKSYKNGGRCIAGKICEDLPDNKVRLHEWARPALLNQKDEAIDPITVNEYQYTNGDFLKVLDIADIPKHANCEVAGQPDNFVVKRGEKWSKHHHFRADCVFNITDTPVDIWLDSSTSTNKTTKAYVDAGKVSQSLYLIRPTSLKITLSNEYNDWNERYQKKTLASFYYNDVLYEDISITCPAARNMLRDSYPDEGAGAITMTLPEGDEYALTLSLSPILESTGMHYKFVATIFDKSGSLQKDYRA
ncbi:dual OB domain-containing protein [Vibrio vulnificus]|uniref:dual OB domain-containing protein n=1 Tax=Vibrio vulnificus TaxID=672 RepID=UPI0019D46733|nr:hypothetical protein [Vibrio vulnificus]MBN8131572.1 hypothetical protein [Vibrio vulnificus]MBN8135993.1 hypothetical protein [Vibrio vulnificus]MBN8158925.1 hypothetical protein [Vibrio vulnificus]HAS6218543.1 hypothetical protein [Vibrio vulnificus]